MSDIPAIVATVSYSLIGCLRYNLKKILTMQAIDNTHLISGSGGRAGNRGDARGVPLAAARAAGIRQEGNHVTISNR
jgi:hypothetical protein